MDTWEPIATAPKDGSRVLLYRPDAVHSLIFVIGRWNPDDGRPYWSHDAEAELGIKDARRFPPTHWHALPDEPTLEIDTQQHSLDDLNRAGHRRHFRRWR